MTSRVLNAMLRRDRSLGSSGVDADTVARAYELLFSRLPESNEVTQLHIRSHADVWSLLRALMDSPEFNSHRTGADAPKPAKGAPCTTLNWLPLLKRFQHPNPPSRRGYITNFLGVMTNVEYLANVRDLPGHIESLPINGGFHCSVSEWIAGLRGVELSGDEFVVVELGAGWAPWMVNLCRAAQMKGARRTVAIGCEADKTHCEYVSRHVAENGLTECTRLFQGAVGLESGITLFPIPKDAANDWAMRPYFCKTEREADAILANPRDFPDHRGITFSKFHRVPCYSLADVMDGLPLVDVLHIDIQGTELDLVRHNLQLLKQRVRYLVIGTHSREIEGGLIETLCREGWILEVEEPCQFDINHPAFSVDIDGTQGWRNPQL
jgi:FkbM family methyltransferase